MSTYILCRASNVYGAHLEGEQPPLIDHKGALVDVRMQSDGHGSGEVLPTFVRFNTTTPLSVLENYIQSWKKAIEWEVQNTSLPLDGYRVRLYTTNGGTSGDGRITNTELLDFINQWNMIIHSHTLGEVVVDISIFEAITSGGFWDKDLTRFNIVFSEISYNQSTGVHRIQADYSTEIKSISKAVDVQVRKRGGVIVSHENKVIIFELNRTDVIPELREGIKNVASNRTVLKRRYKLSDVLVDQAIANGGELVVTPAELLAHVEDLSA